MICRQNSRRKLRTLVRQAAGGTRTTTVQTSATTTTSVDYRSVLTSTVVSKKYFRADGEVSESLKLFVRGNEDEK